MIQLIQDSDGAVIQQWRGLPKRIRTPNRLSPQPVTVGWSGGGYSLVEVPDPPEPLERVKARLLQVIDGDAEQNRLKYITPGHGMAMTYREKFEQAKAVEDLGEAAANALAEAEYVEAYPTLAASIPTEAATLWEISVMVIAKAEAWADLSYRIEKTRIDGKAAIQAATSVDDVESAYASISWE